MASVPDMVSNANLGRMRYQFWRDSLKKVYEVRPSQALNRWGFLLLYLLNQGSPPQHPIAEALCQTVHSVGRVQQYHLKRIIDARVRS
jgi:NADH dehydrogenase [ubiquinone] 1 alpha subcomplex assembly factor 6